MQVEKVTERRQIMLWSNNRTIHIWEYAWVSSNQHGDRFRRKKTKPIKICRMSSNFGLNDSGVISDLRTLITLSYKLGVPVQYDFDADPQIAYIEVVSATEI